MGDDMIEPFVSSDEIEDRVNYAHEILKDRKTQLTKEFDTVSMEVRRREKSLAQTKEVQEETERKLKDINTVLSVYENAVAKLKEKN